MGFLTNKIYKLDSINNCCTFINKQKIENAMQQWDACNLQFYREKNSKIQNAKETIFPNKDYYFHDGIQCYLEQ